MGISEVKVPVRVDETRRKQVEAMIWRVDIAGFRCLFAPTYTILRWRCLVIVSSQSSQDNSWKTMSVDSQFSPAL
jgi:hypothetical protein